MKEIKDNFLEENKVVFKKYKPIKRIGSGSFGNIYSVIRLSDKNAFAMKTEKISNKFKNLESEAYILFALQGGLGIPKLISYGHVKNYNILIETLLDKSLQNIFVTNKKECNLVDICLIGIQLLERLKWIHSKDLIYRDIKPDNFLIGIEDPNVIYIVDFGLCKKYRSSKTGKHILPKLTGQFNGTVKYASPNAIKGKEVSRRDDLISLGYMLIFLFKRDLPWEDSFKNLDRTKYFELISLKETNGVGKLFNNIPQEFKDYIKYTRNLKFEQDPDYSYLSSLFLKIINNMNLDYRKITFSWINEKNKKKLLGIPRSFSKRKENSHFRLYQSIEKEIKLKRELNNKTRNITNILDITKINKNLQNSEKISKKNNSNNFSNKIPLDFPLDLLNKNNIINNSKSIFLNNSIKIKENEKNDLCKKINNKNVQISIYNKIRNDINKISKKKPIKPINNRNSNKKKIYLNTEYNSYFNNKNIFNNKNRNIINPNLVEKRQIKNLEKNKTKENFDNNKRKDYFSKIFVDNKNIAKIELDLSKNIEYKSPFLNKNTSDNKLSINYAINETNNFQNSEKYEMDLMNKKILLNNSKMINKKDIKFKSNLTTMSHLDRSRKDNFPQSIKQFNRNILNTNLNQ